MTSPTTTAATDLDEPLAFLAVDSGMLHIGDPAYRRPEPDEDGYLEPGTHTNAHGVDLGLTVRTIHGDGLYGIFPVLDDAGRTVGLFVDLLGPYE